MLRLPVTGGMQSRAERVFWPHDYGEDTSTWKGIGLVSPSMDHLCPPQEKAALKSCFNYLVSQPSPWVWKMLCFVSLCTAVRPYSGVRGSKEAQQWPCLSGWLSLHVDWLMTTSCFFWRWCSLICPQQRAGLWETVFKVMISKTSVSEITCSSTSLPDLNPELCMSTTGPRGCMPCRRWVNELSAP